MMVPYLKGLHLTLERWRSNRDEEGRKMTPSEWSMAMGNRGEDLHGGTYDHARNNLPMNVVPVPQLKDDVDALVQLMQSSSLPRVLVQPIGTVVMAIMFGDASGTGFGTSLWVQDRPHIAMEHGVWTRAYGDKSSNFQELYNLVAKVKLLVAAGTLRPGTEMFVFTDNATAEAAFYKGTSTSKTLFDLVLQLQTLEMTGNIFVHLVWIAGTRMIAQGTDGLFRGDLMNRVLAGADMLQFVSLSCWAEEHQPGIAAFFVDSMRDLISFQLLEPMDWFEKAMSPGHYIWMPPPAAADVAVEKMCKSKHIRPDTSHVFICPTLMTCRWRKKLGRVADIVFTLPVGSFLWPTSQHEPSIVAFVCPFYTSSPWQLKRVQPAVDVLAASLSEVWASNSGHARQHVRKLWSYAKHKSGLSGSMEWKVLWTE
ncbi:hypothetical protein ACA910_003715 [Epithemia clementina (nom. ined.)]